MLDKTPVGQAFIGTSGWSYLDWKDVFYPSHCPAQDYLKFYAQHFQSVELNNTFYHLPKIQTVAHWAEMVSDDFCFAIKASRFLTHIKKLKGEPESIRRMLDVLSPLQHKIGPILFQCPANLHVDLDRLQAFIDLLPPDYRYAFEFRNADWLSPETYQLLSKANIACCLYDFEKFEVPNVLTADFTYLRFHGPKAKPYTGRYSQAFLSRWAQSIQNWNHSGVDVYCYFDNTGNGAAIHDAKQLLHLVNPAKRVPHTA